MIPVHVMSLKSTSNTITTITSWGIIDPRDEKCLFCSSWILLEILIVFEGYFRSSWIHPTGHQISNYPFDDSLDDIVIYHRDDTISIRVNSLYNGSTYNKNLILTTFLDNLQIFLRDVFLHFYMMAIKTLHSKKRFLEKR